MPELPDLQVFSRNLIKQLKGKTLEKISIPYTKKLKTPSKRFKEALEGSKLKNVERVGKELYFEFDNGNTLALHMMLRGQLYFFEQKNEHKYPIIELYFDDGLALGMSDFQGQATPTLNPESKEAPDALSESVDHTFLKEKLDRKAAIKNILMDQKIIRGIGNAYADEILWHAGISPFSAGNKIPDAKIKALAKSIKTVLQNAEKNILKTHPDIITGEVRDFLPIHNAKKKTSPTGGKIKHDVVGGRKTYYTDEQELFT